jgi:hypothetical protein
MSSTKDQRASFTRATLPFKMFSGNLYGRVLAQLEYEESVMVHEKGMIRMPFRISEGDRIYNPIVTLMKMYWDLESQVSGLIKERDEAKEQLLLLQGNVIADAERQERIKKRADKEANRQ